MSNDSNVDKTIIKYAGKELELKTMEGTSRAFSH